MEDLFKQLVQDIERKYKELRHNLGWRFLSVSQDVLFSNPAIALVTLNPGGKVIPKDHPRASCEDGASYLVESWRNAAPGQSSLQKQIQKLFCSIAEITGSDQTGVELLEASLIGCFVPFRSPRFEDLVNREASLKFGETLWRTVFEFVRPKLIICIDKYSYKLISKMVPEIFRTNLIEEKELPTGWGDVKAEIRAYNGREQVRTLRLPHLSTFKLFSREACVEPLREILRKACNGL